MKKWAIAVLALLIMAACGGGGGGDTDSGGSSNPGTPNAPTVPGMPSAPSSVSNSWWSQAVFYEVFVRSFADGSTGSKAGDGIGDLRGLIERLDYLNDGDPQTTDDLGVTALWLMPVMQSPSYHGYDVTDYYTVENDYGSNDEFRELMDAAHARGIRVIIDLVLNHASNQHPHFLSAQPTASPTHDYFIWANQKPGYQGPWGQEVWHQLGDKYYYGIFWSGMPDWNLRSQAVSQEMMQIARYWLENMNADGFRLDAVRYLFEANQSLQDLDETHDWLRGFHNEVLSAKSDAMIVGEVWADIGTVATYTDDQVDLTFQFDLALAILSAANTGVVSGLQSQLDQSYSSFAPGQFATFITNHDQDRVMSQLNGNVTRAKMAASILLTLPGTPFIYYGEEIGMTGVKPDELIRTPLQWSSAANAGFSSAAPWQPVNDNFATVNINSANADPNSLLSHYRTLIRIRNQNIALRNGHYTPVRVSSSNLMVFLRQTPGQNILIILNPGTASVDNYTVELDADYDNAVELLNETELLKGEAKTLNGIAGFQPIAVIAPQSAYIIRF